MAHLHESLYKDFIGLQRELLEMKDPRASDLDKLVSKVLAVESREPPIYSALNRFCHNQICRIDREYASIMPLKWYHYPLKNFFRFHDLPRKQLAQ